MQLQQHSSYFWTTQSVFHWGIPTTKWMDTHRNASIQLLKDSVMSTLLISPFLDTGLLCYILYESKTNAISEEEKKAYLTTLH